MAREREAERKQSPTWILVILLLLVIVVAFFAVIAVLPTINVVPNIQSKTQEQGQCQFDTQRFLTQQEAFTLAGAAQTQRSAFPFRGNYAIGSYTICYKNSTQQRFQSPVAKGYDNLTDTSSPMNATHGEQAVYQWLQTQLFHLSIDQTTVQGIYAVIFSQVVVCVACQRDMVSWQQTLRQKAGTNRLLLSIWDLNPGFDPATYPAGPTHPVTLNDLKRVSIVFAS